VRTREIIYTDNLF